MEAEQLQRTDYTVEEYLDLAMASERKLEYYNGRIELMAGGTFEHDCVKTDTAEYLTRHRKPGPCEPNSSDLAIRSEQLNSYVYPDIVYTCAPPEFVSGHQRLQLKNPTLVIEVLSGGTEARDLGEKMAAYMSIDSLQEYVIIDSKRCFAQGYYREATGLWRIQNRYKLSQSLTIHTLAVDIPLAEIYRRVKFDPA